jgi:zinc protease
MTLTRIMLLISMLIKLHLTAVIMRKTLTAQPKLYSRLLQKKPKNYYHSILTKSRMLVVVVADLDRADIEAKVKGMLSTIKQGAPFELKKSFFRV